MKSVVKAKAVKPSTANSPGPKAQTNKAVAVQAVDSVAILPADISRNVVAKRAYELWQANDHKHGNDLEHWFEAEKELKEKYRQ